MLTYLASSEWLGVDWPAVGAIVAVLVAVAGVSAYLVGAVRPLAVRKARYWHEGEITRFSCHVKNRSWRKDRTLTALTLVKLPTSFDRHFAAWRDVPQVAEILPWGQMIQEIRRDGIRITTRDEKTVFGELTHASSKPGQVAVDRDVRIEAVAGSKRSRSRRLECL